MLGYEVAAGGCSVFRVLEKRLSSKYADSIFVLFGFTFIYITKNERERVDRDYMHVHNRM